MTVIDFTIQCSIGDTKFRRSLINCILDRCVRDLELGLALGDHPDLFRANHTAVHQENIFKDHPARVFNRTPRRRSDDPEDRLRPEHSAEEMIRRGHKGSRNQNLPIPVER